MTSGKVRINLNLEGTVHSEQSFIVDDGTELHYHVWEPAPRTSPEGVVILVHGLGDHTGHMLTVVEFMAKRMGLIVCGYDQRGHGDSPGSRGHVEKWALLRADLSTFCEFLTQKFPNLPLVFFGNSMGGLCVLDYMMNVQNDRIAGIIVNAPALTMQDLGGFQGTIVNMCSKILPGVAVTAALNSSKLTRDVDKQKENDTDILVHCKASMKLMNDMASIGRWVRDNPDKIKCPLLLLQGTSDPIVFPQENVKFAQNVKNTNENVHIYVTVGGKHETFNDIDRNEVFEQCQTFLQRVLKSPADLSLPAAGGNS